MTIDSGDTDTGSPGGIGAKRTSGGRRPRRALAIGLAPALVVASAAAGLTWKMFAASKEDGLQSIVDGLVDEGYPSALATRTDPSGTRHEVHADESVTTRQIAAAIGGHLSKPVVSKPVVSIPA